MKKNLTRNIFQKFDQLFAAFFKDSRKGYHRFSSKLLSVVLFKKTFFQLKGIINTISPKMASVRSIRKGNHFSRAFRYVFEYNKIYKVLGVNLAALFLSTSLVQFPTNINTTGDESFVTKAPFVLETKKSIQYPVEKISITQGYSAFHPGLDLDGITGDPIRPIMDGVVEDISHSRFAYGNAIIINHGNNITSLYAHLSKIFVKPNEQVTTDTIIGEMGATGHASGDHLHLEVRDNGKPFNPLSVLP